MSTLRTTVLRYRPSISLWSARKKDKEESAKVNENAGAVAGAANVHKSLLPDSPELEAVRKWGDQFRDYVYTNTSPWDDNGWRVGKVDKHMEFMMALGDKMREGDALVEAFIQSYKVGIENARFTLQHLFKESDYPSPEVVRSKFHFSVEVATIPDADDFRIIDGLPPDEVATLVAATKGDTEARIASAMEGAYERLYEVVAKMATTLDAFGSKKVKKFNDTLVSNIADLVAVMPALNITDDPKLADLAQKARDLAMYAAVDLRKDDVVRKAAITEAQALAAEIRPNTTVSVAAPVAPTVEPNDKAALFADMLGS